MPAAACQFWYSWIPKFQDVKLFEWKPATTTVSPWCSWIYFAMFSTRRLPHATSKGRACLCRRNFFEFPIFSPCRFGAGRTTRAWSLCVGNSSFGKSYVLTSLGLSCSIESRRVRDHPGFFPPAPCPRQVVRVRKIENPKNSFGHGQHDWQGKPSLQWTFAKRILRKKDTSFL